MANNCIRTGCAYRDSPIGTNSSGFINLLFLKNSLSTISKA